MFKIEVFNKNNKSTTMLVDSETERLIEFNSREEAEDHISMLEARRLLPHSNIEMKAVPSC